MKQIATPKDSHLSRVKVFQALDGQLALNIYTFLNNNSESYGPATEEDTKFLFQGLDKRGVLEEPGAEKDMRE